MPIRGDNFVLVHGVNSDVCYAVLEVTLRCPVMTARGRVELDESLPLKGIQFLLGSDLAGCSPHWWVYPVQCYQKILMITTPTGDTVSSH